jgi:HD superfamily phosphohydrolase
MPRPGDEVEAALFGPTVAAGASEDHVQAAARAWRKWRCDRGGWTGHFLCLPAENRYMTAAAPFIDSLRRDQMEMPKLRRIRDPVHDLIEFGLGELDRLAWMVLDTAEFQRLRRIKQLGFSELVFPGATHSRLAHSIGVFHTARQLSKLIGDRLGVAFEPERADVAQAAALVHDLGHGPFSHSFEDALKQLGIKKRHEEWTAEIVTGDTAVCEALARHSSDFPRQIAELLASETPVDIYSAIVSSQFDADRLDYVRRDRLMTGAQHGGFDFSWLVANLEVDKIAISLDAEQYGEVQSLVLGNKAFQAAEAYVLGLFHLYFTVYFHKTTRSAEKMLAALLKRVGDLVKDGLVEETGLSTWSPIVLFLRNQSLRNYLALDDVVMWASLQQMTLARDDTVSELASRLINRRLYKAIDVTARLQSRGRGDARVARFRAQLAAVKDEFGPFDVLEDQATRNPYKRRGFDSPDALSKVLIRRIDGNAYEDLADRSDVVAALQQESTFRVYVRAEGARDRIEQILRGIS